MKEDTHTPMCWRFHPEKSMNIVTNKHTPSHMHTQLTYLALEVWTNQRHTTWTEGQFSTLIHLHHAETVTVTPAKTHALDLSLEHFIYMTKSACWDSTLIKCVDCKIISKTINHQVLKLKHLVKDISEWIRVILIGNWFIAPSTNLAPNATCLRYSVLFTKGWGLGIKVFV